MEKKTILVTSKFKKTILFFKKKDQVYIGILALSKGLLFSRGFVKQIDFCRSVYGCVNEGGRNCG